MTHHYPHDAPVQRVGLFFDGTGNNAANDRTAPTNIAKLSRLYAGPGASVKAIYVPGIGTQAAECDSLLGSALGRGRTGVLARVESALAQVRQVAIGGPVTVDLFGFSRGAAAARHCANLLTQLPGVRVGFVGLFDTVVAVAGPAKLQLHLDPARFPDVVHLVARDEYREHFALTHVCAGHLELEVPGAHSDIGGGYFDHSREQLLVGPMQALTVSRGTPVTSTSIYRDAERLKSQWLARGWPSRCLSIVTPPPTPLTDRSQPQQHRVYAALQLEREVRGELSRVYLRLMHQQAIARGVPLLPIPASDECVLPPRLAPLCQAFLRGDFSLTPEDDAWLRLDYIHVSAHWNPPDALQGNQPRLGARALYINAPAANGKRVRYRH